MAIVDHDYCFRYMNAGANGRNSDGGVFRQCPIYQELENNMLPDGGFLVGDDAFPLKPFLLKPHSHRSLSYAEKVFNYRLSRARGIVENAFGILVSRFRIFQKPMGRRFKSRIRWIFSILPTALWPWGRLSLKPKWVPGIFLGGKKRPARRADNLTAICEPIV
jgi:hypothetical protein